jgi:hypothetical protein
MHGSQNLPCHRKPLMGDGSYMSDFIERLKPFSDLWVDNLIFAKVEQVADIEVNQNIYDCNFLPTYKY